MIPGSMFHSGLPMILTSTTVATQRRLRSSQSKLFMMLPTTNAFMLARDLLQSAEQIVFLGFGFDPTNLGRLEPSAIRRDAKLVQYLWHDVCGNQSAHPRSDGRNDDG